MGDMLDEIVANARTSNGPCEGCPATRESRTDGQPRSEGVNPGLGHYDAEVVFVTIEPSPPHGKAIDWDAYDWTGYNDRYYKRLLEHWDSGEAVREIIAPVAGVTTSDVWVADSIKCPLATGQDDQKRTEEFAHCRDYLARELEEVNPEIVITLGNRPATRTFSGRVRTGSDGRSNGTENRWLSSTGGRYPPSRSTRSARTSRSLPSP